MRQFKTVTALKCSKLVGLALTLIASGYFNLAVGYDFTQDSKRMLDQLAAEDNQPPRLTLLFLEPRQQNLKYIVDLVQLKAQLVNDFAEFFGVTDPFFVADYLADQGITPSLLLNDPELRNKAKLQFGNDYFLKISITAVTSDNLGLSYILYDEQGAPRYSFDSLHRIEAPNQTKPPPLKQNESFTLPKLNIAGTKGEPWGYYHPRAFVHEGIYLQTSLWIHDFKRAEVSGRNFRLGYNYGQLVEWGLVANGSEFKRLHSGYLQAKLQFINEDIVKAPLFMALGIKTRYYWDEDDNRDFDYEVPNEPKTEEFKDLDKLSFYLAVDYRLDPLKLMLSGYWDNLNLGFDANFYLPYRAIAGLHLWAPTAESDFKEPSQDHKYSDPDLALSLRQLTTSKLSLELSYQRRPDLLAIGVALKL